MYRQQNRDTSPLTISPATCPGDPTQPAMRSNYLRRTSASSLLLTSSLGLLLSGCGVGTVGTVAGVNSNDDPEPQVRVNLAGSSPSLSPLDPGDPLMLGLDEARGVDPMETIVVRFTEDINVESVTEADFDLQFFPSDSIDFFNSDASARVVPIQSITRQAREVRLNVAGSINLSSRYRLIVRNIDSSSGETTIPTTQSFFVTRDGRWAEPELVTQGSFAGGITLTRGLAQYTTTEISNPGGSSYKVQAFARGRFGDPWQTPEAFFFRDTGNAGQTGVQFQTGGFLLSDEIGTLQINEGDPNEADALDHFMTIRAPIATFEPGTDLTFGDRRFASDFTSTDGRIDISSTADTAELDGPHFSVRGPMALDGRDVATTFWALSNPVADATATGSEMKFDDQRVYASNIVATEQWQDWDSTIEISAPSEAHNSVPFMAEFDDGNHVVIWYAADTTASLFDGTADRYWVSRYQPGTGWSVGADITPSGESGLAVITDVKARIPGAILDAERDVVVFGRDSSGAPSARIWNPVTGWQAPVMAPTTDVVRRPVLADYNNRIGSDNNLPYGTLRGRVYGGTPLATSIGRSKFVVRWVSQADGADPALMVAMFDATESDPALAWTDIQDLSPFAALNLGNAANSKIDFTVDPNGWATIIWTELDAAEDQFVIKAQRTNLITSGLGGFATSPTPPQVISPGNFDARFPFMAESHPTGVTTVVWVFSVREPMTGATVLLGSAQARLE